MADSRFVRPWNEFSLELGGATGSGEVWQLPHGGPGAFKGVAGNRILGAGSSGSVGEFDEGDKRVLTKAAGFVALRGGRAYWDHSTNSVSYKKVGHRDFYLGRFTRDSTSADVECEVALGFDPPYDLDFARDPCLSVTVGTQALGGFLPPARLGGALAHLLSSTNEAQKVDCLGIETFDKSANAIVEFAIRVINGSAGSAPDFNIGVASGTHATSFDSIANYLALHIDGNSTNLNLQSADGSTTVAATDTTTDYTAGSAIAQRVEGWFDFRDPADVQCYLQGVLMLPSTVFDMSAAANELRLITHLEKTAAADTCEIVVDWLRARFMEQ